MILDIKIILGILFIHWIADFILQTEEIASNKSTSIPWLSLHVGVYSITWLISLLLFFDFSFSVAFYFSIVTFIIHGITDYYTSRLTSNFYQKKLYRYFFNTIGFDQFLHFVQLFLLFALCQP